MKISFYYVNPDYINRLKTIELSARGFTTVPNVEYSHHKKFVYGIIMMVNNINYYVPVSSYKKNQKDNLLIRIEDHHKIVTAGSLRFNYMIPVPKEYLVPVDFSSSLFTEKERSLLHKEYKACLRMLSQAQKKAQKTYMNVVTGSDEVLIRNSCAFQLLEQEYKRAGTK